MANSISGLPLYKEAISSSAWRSRTAHRGLVFNKFGDAWQGGKFDKAKDDENKWLKAFAKKTAGNQSHIEDILIRQDRLLRSMKGRPLCFKNESPFIAGMGLEHPTENGMVWHHTLGVPYLPASSLKGILRAWYRETYGKLEDLPLPLAEGRGEGPQIKQVDRKWIENDATIGLFGASEGDAKVGEFIILDLLPAQPVKLSVDIMTPHYSPYYQKQEIPGDWHDPTPLSFLAVERGQQWQTGILLRTSNGSEEDRQKKLDELASMLREALSWLGAGAKTAVGYGRFKTIKETDLHKQMRKEVQAREKEREKQKKIDALPAEFRNLIEGIGQYFWTDERKLDPKEFLSKVEEYLASSGTVTEQVLKRFQDGFLFFEKHRSGWKNVWKKPEEKSKDKTRKKAARLVKALKAALEEKG